MPKYTPIRLRWVEQAQRYVIFVDNQATEQELNRVWLDQTAAFAFHSRWGMHYTVRKQKVQRGSQYWYAYRRLHGHIVKRYLGKSADLTLTHLEDIARHLEILSRSRPPSFEPDHATSAPQPTPPIRNPATATSLAPVAAPPLLVSKLSPPRLPGFLLDRARLFALLDNGRAGPLTLVSAPAGFGKTTLLCQWLAARRTRSDSPPVAWVTLEPADNDPLRFWRYLITACQTFDVNLDAVHAALRVATPQPPFVASSLEPVLIALLNALAHCPSHSILVLDDYQAITVPEIQDLLCFFLDHLPANLHVIMVTRSDPPLSLPRRRAHNVLYEIRTADLRFSRDETARLLLQALPFQLEAATIQRLHAHLQGWGAGLHLIRLSLQRATTPAHAEHIVVLFTQNNVSLHEYVVSEVLDRQSEPVQQFVLQTSLLTHLTPSLCDAVTAQPNSQDMLAQLERANVFLEQRDAAAPDLLPAAQPWYRYQALFAQAMRTEARRRLGDEHLRLLSLRASHWYAKHGLLHEAIDIAVSVQEYEWAATVIARSLEELPFLHEMHEPHTLQRWFAHLPEPVLAQNPVLCLSYAATLLFQSASWQPTALTLPLVEKLVGMAEPGFRTEQHLPKRGELFAFRALLALRTGDTPTATRDAEQALACLPQTHSVWRGLSLSVVAEHWIQLGEFQQAGTALRDAYAQCEAVSNRFFKRVALIKLAQVCVEQGEIQQATALFRQARVEARVDEHTPTLAHWRCVAVLGLATLCYDGNDLDGAYQHAQEAITISQSQHLVHHEVHATRMLARVYEAQGQVGVAQQCLMALLDTLPISLPSLSRVVQTAQARLAVATRDSISVQRWMTGRTPQNNDAPEFEEELLVSRWLRTQGNVEAAARRLERLRAMPQTLGHRQRMLEIQAEMVLLEASRKHKTTAHHMLRDLLVLACASNAQRVLLDAGEPMATLVRSLRPQIHDQSVLAFIGTLLRAVPGQHASSLEAQRAGLVEPLSRQEMRVLRLLVQQRSNADIAAELVVSVNTVRSQLQSIYSKLGVHTRTAAGDVARELRLIS